MGPPPVPLLQQVPQETSVWIDDDGIIPEEEALQRLEERYEPVDPLMRMVTEVPDDLHARFKAETRRQGVSQAGIIRNLVEKWLQKPDSAVSAPKPAPKRSGAPASAQEAQSKRDEILRKAAKGR